MQETLTTTESKNLIDSLKQELQRIRTEIKTSGAVSAVGSVLKETEGIIQEELNKIAAKGGFLTEDDYTRSYEMLKASKRGELVSLKKKQNTRMYVGIGVLVIVAAAYFYYRKNGKS